MRKWLCLYKGYPFGSTLIDCTHYRLKYTMYISIFVTVLLAAAAIADAALTCTCTGCTYSLPKPKSCKEIALLDPNAESGEYGPVLDDTGTEICLYCDMDSPCGGAGWTRIANVDMTNDDAVCPAGLTLYEESGVRVCKRNINTGGCNAARFCTHGIQYSEVCGRVIAYEFNSPSAFQPLNSDINSVYVEGISITRGSPREHIWTYATGLQDTHSSGRVHQCPCSTNGDSDRLTGSFVGNDYYCESGNHGTRWEHRLYLDDPIFDNDGCTQSEAACCNKGLLPYFHKDLGSNSNDDIEFRICADQNSDDEDTAVFIIELYVR